MEIQKGFSHAGHMRTGMHCGFSKTCNKVASSEKQKTVVVVIILEASVRILVVIQWSNSFFRLERLSATHYGCVMIVLCY